MSGSTELETDFDIFWAAYPRKVGKAAARKAFEKAKKKTTVGKMVETLAWQKNQPQWVKDGGMYIPHASTWLNEERWDDEPFYATPDRRNDRLSGLRAFIEG